MKPADLLHAAARRVTPALHRATATLRRRVEPHLAPIARATAPARRMLGEAIRNLAAARQRSLLALLGILIGTGSVIAMINIGTIVQAEALREFLAMGTDVFVVNGSGGRTPMTIGDVDELRAQQETIRDIVPVLSAGQSTAYRGKSVDARIAASTSGFWPIAKMTALEGRLLSDFDRLEPFAMVGRALRNEMANAAGRMPQVGDEVRIGRHIFTIIGFFDSPSSNSLLPFGPERTLFVSVPNLKRLSPTSQLDTLVGRTAPGATTQGVTQQVTDFLSHRHPGMSVNVATAEALIRQMEKQMRLYTLLLGAVGSIALIVGGVGVMNVMLVSVTERKREIGIRMAIGARAARIRAMFLSEALVLSLLGGALGTALGLGASAIMASASGWSFVLAKMAIPLGAGISAAVGIFFGYYPAVQASRLDPIEALRAE